MRNKEEAHNSARSPLPCQGTALMLAAVQLYHREEREGFSPLSSRKSGNLCLRLWKWAIRRWGNAWTRLEYEIRSKPYDLDHATDGAVISSDETDIQLTTGSPTRLPASASAGSPLELLKTLANVSLHRSARGLIHLEVRLSQVGLVELELTQDSFVRLMFGEAAIQAEVTRHIQKRRHVHSENEA